MYYGQTESFSMGQWDGCVIGLTEVSWTLHTSKVKGEYFLLTRVIFILFLFAMVVMFLALFQLNKYCKKIIYLTNFPWDILIVGLKSKQLAGF